MLADVIKEVEKKRQLAIQEENAKYNKPYKRDTIIYFDHMYMLGGIQTWITNLSKQYEFSVVYDYGDKERLDYLKDMGIECIKSVGQPIECNTLITCIFGNPEKIKSKRTILAIHGDYKELPINNIPKHDEVVCVSQLAANSWKEVTGEDSKVIHMPIEIFDTTKPLIIGVFSRLSKEKGRWRVEILAEKLIEKNKPFLMLVFSDFKLNVNDKRVLQFEPIMNPSGWMSKCDYVCQLSDTEASGLTIQESLKMNIPVIVTKLPVLEEIGVNSSNAKILNFDMSNLDIEDLWNKPKVNWKELESKGWEDIMKKKVFREKNLATEVGEAAKEVLETYVKEKYGDDVKVVPYEEDFKNAKKVKIELKPRTTKKVKK